MTDQRLTPQEEQVIRNCVTLGAYGGKAPVYVEKLLAEIDRLRGERQQEERAAFQAGFAARPPDKNNWDRVYVTGELRQWDFSPGGSAWDLKDQAFEAYLATLPAVPDATVPPSPQEEAKS